MTADSRPSIDLEAAMARAAHGDRGDRHRQVLGRDQGCRASCECGWEPGIGSTEQVMPEIRTHLDAAVAATQLPVEQPARSGSRICRP